ncbi:hypothetical protein [Pumilibacter intestinalis]|jgi:cell division protein FtsL|uniref:hypothetical protein n=1 Tax=Pumilibacter intestinalis TaxID=2941511 RepID=UPI00203C0C93|nr:hypothetical protein [Pumilibacter intestinalis]
MVTTRRRITNEQDRFGGYGLSPAQKSVTFEEETETPAAQRENRISFRTTTDEPYFGNENATKYSVDDRALFTERETRREVRTAEEEQPVIEYSQRPYFGTFGYEKTVTAPARVKKSRKREKEDVMPSIRTRAYAKEQEKEQPAPREKTRISGKGKVALLVYAAAVVILAVMVIATGLAVSSINASSASLENEIAAKNARLSELNAEIREYTNLDKITGAAINNGMEKVEGATEVELLPTESPTDYEGRTNWFDKFCDFLSNIVGG